MKQPRQKLGGWLVLPVLCVLMLFLPLCAGAQGYECEAEIPVRVELNGNSSEEFTVVILGSSDADPMPAQQSLQVAGGGSATFTGLHFTEPGDYVYSVLQAAGNTEHMTYDDAVYAVTVRVTNDGNGGLQCELWAVKDGAAEKTQEVRFLNTYAPPPPATATPVPADEPQATSAPTPAPAPQATPAPTPAPLPGWLPQTGDDLPLGLLAGLAILAAAAAAVLAALRRRSKK